MTEQIENYRKATSLAEVDNAVRFDVPIKAGHPFFTDFSDVRGEFEEKVLYKSLNVDPGTFQYYREKNIANKSLVFLAGMRGSGKTTELAKVCDKLNRPECFLCIVCDLDKGLDSNDMEYMDILIYQMESLFEILREKDIDVNEDILKSLQSWFSERIQEVNRVIKKEGGFEVEIKAETPSLLSFLGITAKVKANLQGTKENASKIRTVLKTNFTDFSRKLNEFFEHVNMEIRKKGIAQELLFVVDGMEKVATRDLRSKIVIGEIDRIRQIKANTIFTLPIELMSETQRIAQMNTVLSFPFVKLRERKGDVIPRAVERFREFVHKRIDGQLFDTPDTVTEAILYSGGSPRELLRILEYANLYADESTGKITREALDKGLKKLASLTAQYIQVEEFEKLKQLKDDNEKGLETAIDGGWQDLIEKLIVFEYNDGTYKRVNPVVELSGLYKRYVG
jgi:hypothetical protein